MGKAAADFLSSSLPLLHDKLTMSDGMSYHYSLTRSIIDHLQCEEGVLIRNGLEKFISSCGITDKKNVLLLLRGTAAGNVFFEQNLCTGFSSVLKTDKRLRSNTMHLLISEPNPYHNSEVNQGPTIIESGTETDTIIDPQDGSTLLRSLKREWREVRASASGKVRKGNSEEAKGMLTVFLQKIGSVRGCDALKEEVNKELLSIPENRVIVEPPKPGKPRKHDSEIPHTNSEPSEGESLIKQGKLKDARDWYRNNNDNSKARILSDIIRSKKGVEMRYASLESCQKSKNNEQIDRIIIELNEYIDLCCKVGYSCDDVRALLISYRKIK